MSEKLSPEQRQGINQYLTDNLVQLLEEDLALDISEVGSDKIEIVISKGFGSTERLEVKATTHLNKARQTLVAMYRNVVNPRALSYAKETVDYQLEADRMAREVQTREDAETGSNKTKKGKR